MSFTTAQKGNARASPTPSSASSSSSASDSSVTTSSSESESESEAEDPNKYLALARESIRAKAAAAKDNAFVSLADSDEEDDVIALEDPEDVLQCVISTSSLYPCANTLEENCHLLIPVNYLTLTLHPDRASEKTHGKHGISTLLAQCPPLRSYNLVHQRRPRLLSH